MAVLLLTSLLLSDAAPTPHPHPKPHRPVRYAATAYCTRGTTDAGTKAHRGIVAADPRLLPFGSVIRVDGLGRTPQTFVVTDSGSAIKGRRLDIFMPSCRAAKRFGRHTVIARVVRSMALTPASPQL